MKNKFKRIAALLTCAAVALPILTAIPFAAAAPPPDNSAAPEPAAGREFLSQYVQTLFGDDSMIPMIDVKSILQTDDGYMWFAGYQGLMQYNGTDTRLFTPEDGFPSYKVNTLFEDSSGRLWIGMNDNGVAVYDGGKFTVFGLDDGLPSPSVRNFSEDRDGVIYIATADGVARINQSNTLVTHPLLNAGVVTQIEYIGNGRFISLFNDGRIVKHNDSEIIKDLPPEHFGGDTPLRLFHASSGVLYIGTNATAIYLTDATLMTHSTIRTEGLLNHNYFYEDSMRRIWVTADNGAGFLHNSVLTVLDGLVVSNRIEAFYEDFEGNFWLGSSRSGVLQLTHGKFTNISFIAGLGSYVVNSTAIRDELLYIGTDSGLLILQNYLPIHTELTHMLAGIRVRGLLVDSRNRLWISTTSDYGVVMVTPEGEVTFISANDGLASNRVRCIAEAPNGDIYVGMAGGLSVIRDGQVVRTFTKYNGLSNDMVLSITVGDGVMVVGSDGGGLYLIDGDEIVANYTKEHGLSSGVILRTAFDGNGLWIAADNVVNYMNERGISVFEKLDLHADTVFDIKIFGDEIWFLRQRGISIGSIENLLSDSPPQWLHLQRRDGFSSSVTANSWNTVSRDGTLYLSMATQVLSINTRDLRRNEVMPKATISGIFADGVQLFANPADGVLTVPSSVNRLDIHIALLSFTSREGTISYMLEGFDDDFFTENRTDRSLISYTNLSGGSYSFRLFGTNADGLDSDTIILLIEKEFGLFERPFVQLMIVLLIAGLVFLITRTILTQRTRILVRQKMEYKESAGRIMSVASQMSDLKEAWLRGHSQRVAEYSKMVGQRLGMDDDELETLYYAALLHDIGRVTIPETVHNKAGSLTESEYEIVKNHVRVGGDLLDGVSVMGDISVGAKFHQERIDGTGYGSGLKGDEIPLMARIVTVCNAFDSMLCDRPHKKAMSIEKVQSEFIANAGTQFDERITAVLISLIHEGEVPFRQKESAKKATKSFSLATATSKVDSEDSKNAH